MIADYLWFFKGFKGVIIALSKQRMQYISHSEKSFFLLKIKIKMHMTIIRYYRLSCTAIVAQFEKLGLIEMKPT